MSWERLEGGHIDPNITEGITSAIADPLWLLARQWQVGEFRGEDAASPVLFDAAVVAGPVTEYWVDTDDGRKAVSRAGAAWPLETHVEHEPITDGPAATRLRLEGGAALLRDMRQAGAKDGIDDLVTAFEYKGTTDDPLDPVGSAQLAMLARRVPDATQVAAALAATGGDPALVAELSAQPAAVLTAVSNWYQHHVSLFCDLTIGQPSAWDAARLEYRFGLTAELPGGGFELPAPEYPGGTLDWFHVDAGKRLDKVGTATPIVRKRLTSLPSPMQYAGMPASRWWEFEDHDVDFGDMAGGPDDLARSVLAAYSMVAGDDWFSVPCDLPAGTIARVERLMVLDDFGDTTPVRSAAANDAAGGRKRVWRFFELSGDLGPAAGRAPLLFLPPVVHSTEQSRPIEQVEFRRDEMANIAWAIEHRVESIAGRPVDRHAPRTPAPSQQSVPSVPDAWRYRLSTDVPDHWVPLVPVRIDGDRPQIALRRGRIAVGGGEQRAKGRILEPEHAFVMHEEEIPSGGVKVERRWQLARGADGKVRLWVGRKKSPSGGPLARTPLRFDELSGYRHRPRT